MAVPTLLNTPTVIDACDSGTSGWSTLPTWEPDQKKQGVASASVCLRSSTAWMRTGLSLNLTGAHLAMWFNTTCLSYLVDTQCIRMAVTAGGTTHYWTIRKKAASAETVPEYTGGWTLLMLDLSKATDAGATPTLTSVTAVGIQLQFGATLPRNNIINTWIDNIYYIPSGAVGYKITGGTSGDRVTWATVAAADTAAGWGIVVSDSGVYRVNAPIAFGDDTGTAACYFNSPNEIVVTGSGPVNAAFYKLNAVGNATGATDLLLTGSTFKASGSGFSFDMSPAAVDVLSIDGCTFQNAGAITFKTGQSVTNTTFRSCGLVTSGGATMTTCTFASSTNEDALVVANQTQMAAVTNCLFLSNTHGVRLTGTAAEGNPYLFTGHTFTSNTADVHNASGGVIYISPSATCNVSSKFPNDANTVITSTPRVLTLTGVLGEDVLGAGKGSEIRIYKHSDGTELAGIESYAGGAAFTYPYQYAGDMAVDIVVFVVGYLPIFMPFTLKNENGSVVIQQVKDRQYNNPS